MKSLILSLLLSLALAGCGPQPVAAEESRPSARTDAPAAAAPEPASHQTASGDAVQAGQEQGQKEDQAVNPHRIYQLADLETTTIEIGGQKFTVWIMDTESKRREGMMFLRDPEVKLEQGMLFVFGEDQPLSFWMRNTLIPLDLAYIRSDGRIVSTHRMRALDEEGVPSKGPAKYVLEMKQGAFAKFDIREGMTVKIPPHVKAKDRD
jgi:uncharacterized protein